MIAFRRGCLTRSGWRANIPRAPLPGRFRSTRFTTPNSPDKAPVVDPVSYRLNVSGLVDDRSDWTLDRLYALPRVTQITRHICIEGWSAVGKWSGVRFSDFLRRSAPTCARSTSRSIATTNTRRRSICRPRSTRKRYWRSGSTTAVLPRQYGFPMKMRIPTKLGFKNPKHIGEIEVGNDYTGGYWETYGYNWFSGL